MRINLLITNKACFHAQGNCERRMNQWWPVLKCMYSGTLSNTPQLTEYSTVDPTVRSYEWSLLIDRHIRVNAPEKSPETKA